MRGAPFTKLLALALGVLPALGLGCGAPERPPGPFCETLRALERGEVPLGDDANELAGHVASLDALLAVAPAAIASDLAGIREKLMAARDAGGLRTLFVFADPGVRSTPSLSDVPPVGMPNLVGRTVAEADGPQESGEVRGFGRARASSRRLSQRSAAP